MWFTTTRAFLPFIRVRTRHYVHTGGLREKKYAVLTIISLMSCVFIFPLFMRFATQQIQQQLLILGENLLFVPSKVEINSSSRPPSSAPRVGRAMCARVVLYSWRQTGRKCLQNIWGYLYNISYVIMYKEKNSSFFSSMHTAALYHCCWVAAAARVDVLFTTCESLGNIPCRRSVGPFDWPTFGGSWSWLKNYITSIYWCAATTNVFCVRQMLNRGSFCVLPSCESATYEFRFMIWPSSTVIHTHTQS